MINLDYINYKRKFTLQERKTKFKEQEKKFPDFIQIVVEKHKRSKLNPLEKCKYDLKLDFWLKKTRFT